MVAQVVAVGASLLLGGAQGLDFPHRLTDLQLEVVPGLFQLAAGALSAETRRTKTIYATLHTKGMNSTAA